MSRVTGGEIKSLGGPQPQRPERPTKGTYGKNFKKRTERGRTVRPKLS